MTINNVLTAHTFIGCADNVLTIDTNADPKVLSKIEQFARLCKINDLVQKVAALPKAPQMDIDLEAALAKGTIYVRVNIIVKIKPYTLADTNFNYVFIDCFVNNTMINGIESLDNRIIAVIKQSFINDNDKVYRSTVKVGIIGWYDGPANELGDVAFTQMLSLSGSKESIDQAYDISQLTADNISNGKYKLRKLAHDNDIKAPKSKFYTGIDEPIETDAKHTTVNKAKAFDWINDSKSINDTIYYRYIIKALYTDNKVKGFVYFTLLVNNDTIKSVNADDINVRSILFGKSKPIVIDDIICISLVDHQRCTENCNDMLVYDVEFKAANDKYSIADYLTSVHHRDYNGFIAIDNK